MSEPVPSQTLTFHCWRNLSTGSYQWRVAVTGEAHGPELESEEDARAWFDEHGGFRELARERWERVPERVKEIVDETLAKRKGK